MNKKEFFGKGNFEVKGLKEDGSFEACVSDMSVDRYGEIIDIKGWDTKAFMKNPVMLWAHDHSIPAIGKATKVWAEDDRLMLKGEFAPTPFAQQIKQLVEGGFINSFSVGFLAKEMKDNKFIDQELLEVSFVNVPANANATMLAFAKEKKLDLVLKAFGEKGAVQDELDAEENFEMKCQNMEDVFEVFYAFCDAYFNEETPATDFQTMLVETIIIMQKVADGTYEGGDEQSEGGKNLSKLFSKEKHILFSKSDLEEFKKSLTAEEKAGKVVSAKNKEVIQNAIAGIEVVLPTLKELLTLDNEEEASLKSAQESEQADNKSSDEEDKKELVKKARNSIVRALQLLNNHK